MCREENRFLPFLYSTALIHFNIHVVDHIEEIYLELRINLSTI